jgi:hypothetical protein
MKKWTFLSVNIICLTHFVIEKNMIEHIMNNDMRYIILLVLYVTYIYGIYDNFDKSDRWMRS